MLQIVFRDWLFFVTLIFQILFVNRGVPLLPEGSRGHDWARSFCRGKNGYFRYNHQTIAYLNFPCLVAVLLLECTIIIFAVSLIWHHSILHSRHIPSSWKTLNEESHRQFEPMLKLRIVDLILGPACICYVKWK